MTMAAPARPYPFILVISLDGEAAAAIEAHLGCDHYLLSVQDVAEALSLCKFHQPDLILIASDDSGLPYSEPLKQLAACPCTLAVPWLVVTRSNRIEASEREYPPGAMAGAGYEIRVRPANFIALPATRVVFRSRVKLLMLCARVRRRLI